MNDPINKSVISRNGTFWEPTTTLRFVDRIIHHPYKSHTATAGRILQQAYICHEQDLCEWRDVPLEIE